MRKILFGVVGAAALAMSSVASATITVGTTSFTSDSTSTDGITTTIGYEDTGLGKPSFTEWLNFTNSLAGIYSVTLDTSSSSVNFTSAYLTDGTNNYALTCLVGCASGSIEFWGLDDTLLAAGAYTLNVLGNNTGTGSLGGTITITDHGVPEPATWAMMLVGFGAIGWQLRRRRSSLALAQAA
jgi:hypothetical protein